MAKPPERPPPAPPNLGVPERSKPKQRTDETPVTLMKRLHAAEYRAEKAEKLAETLREIVTTARAALAELQETT